MMQNPFAGTGQATVTERGYPPEPGFYGLEIVRCIYFQTLQKGMAYIVEFKITDSESRSNPAGSKCSYYRGMQNLPMAFGEIKLFLLSVGGEQIASQIDALALASSDARNILVGMRVAARIVEKFDKNGKVDRTTGKPLRYLNYEFTSYPNGVQAQQGAEMLRRLQSNPNAQPLAPRAAPAAFGGGNGASQGYGAPQQGYGAPPPQTQFGAPPQAQGGFGGPPPQAQGGFGGPPPQGGFGGPPPQTQFGAPPQGGFGGQPQGQPFGGPPQGGFGGQPQGQPFGPPNPYGQQAAPPQGPSGPTPGPFGGVPLQPPPGWAWNGTQFVQTQ